ncbi:high-temperature-induced dauer-formation protein-domain-containing protein [Coprinopsis sp. MPI-PUGE-AT-0042]|nr:high-temperature-induced dauer-formation protein-domain-containing protein [Coprinopsis sp. MPI-PUGE-AT-0042]
MFSKIPQRFSAPFGLLGDEAKLAFPSQPEGITKLWTTRNISARDSYWDQYFILFDSASDVYSLITPHQIRRALLEAPENVATLIRVVCNRLFDSMTDHTFPSAPPGSASATVAAFTSIMKTGASDRNPTKELLNSIRILQRVLPVLFDIQGETSAFEMELLWTGEEVDDVHAHEPASSDSQFVIEDDDEEESEEDEDEEGGSRTPNATPAPAAAPKKKRLPSLGERLINAVVDLMYTCGFTLSPRVQVEHHKVQYIIWEKGIGSTSDAAASSAFDSNKIEVLRLLLVLFSRQIYVPPSSLLSKPSQYTLHFVQKIPRRDVLTLLCSLLNTAMNTSAPQESSIASLGAMAGKLPYNHLVFKGEDSRVVLTGMCLQVLCVLLDFQSGSAKDTAVGEGEGSPTAKSNAFRFFLMKLHRTQDFDFILSGITGILLEQMNSMNKLLPGARKPVPYIPETIMLFWKMIELNKKFRAYFLESSKCMDIVSYLLCYCIEIKDKPQQHGLCRAISYIIQTLSSEQAFGRQLATQMKAAVPTTWSGVHTCGDFLLHAIHAVVSTTTGTLSTLYPALIISISNAAPYFKKLSVTASGRLTQLFTSFANPSFLLADEGHPRLLFFMLEAFNSVIQYHLNENPALILDILTSHKVFEDLGSLTLISGLREVKRRELAKEELAKRNATASPPPSKDKGLAQDSEPADPVAEKAALLQNETWNRGASLEEAASSSPSLSGNFDQAGGPSDTGDEEEDTLGGMSSPLSEKARGKLRQKRSPSSMSIDMSSISLNLDQMALSVGRNGFVPTQDWVTSWQQGLPLDSIMILIAELWPKVQNIQSTNRANNLNFILDFIAHASIREMLPAPVPHHPRKFTWTDSSIIWLTSLIWGEVYVRGMSPLGVWNATNVRLFYVKHSTVQPRQISETMSNVVGGIGGFLGRRGSETNVNRARTG